MKKIGLLCLALVLALGTMGAGLAYWNETLTIGGTVVTGELNAMFSSAECTDNETGLNVGTCAVALSNSGDHNGDDVATITIKNAYPCYVCDVVLTVKNNGSIPLKIVGVVITNPNATELKVELTDNPAGKIVPVEGTVTFDLHTHVLDGAAEKATYTFSAVVNITQFNN